MIFINKRCELTKRAERRVHGDTHSFEASAGRKAVRGFTLVEMLVALFIISVTVVFVLIVVGTITVTRNAMYENVAFRIVDNKLDELRAGGYAVLPANGPFSNPELLNLPQGVASTSITDWNTKTKQVSAGVSWRDADDFTHFVSLTTLITETGGL